MPSQLLHLYWCLHPMLSLQLQAIVRLEHGSNAMGSYAQLSFNGLDGLAGVFSIASPTFYGRYRYRVGINKMQLNHCTKGKIWSFGSATFSKVFTFKRFEQFIVCHNATHSVIEPQHQPRNSALGASMPTHQRLVATCQIRIKPIRIATARTLLPRLVII